MIVDSVEPIISEVVIVEYEGGKNKTDGSFHGKGKATLDNGCTYKGSFSNGLFNGKGRFTWNEGVIYEGEFFLGEMSGKGTFKWPDKSTYKGSITNGKRDGDGKFTNSLGQVYEGNWLLGKRNGQGKLTYNEEGTSFYNGAWCNNLRHGQGVMRYSSGNQYEGDWVDDKKCGLGVMSWKDVDEVYTGNWLNDHPHGYGEHIWGGEMNNTNKIAKKQMCNIYRGQFEAGARAGLGHFFYMNGSQYSGYWKDDMKNGDGVFIYADGRIEAANFNANRMQYLPDSPLAAQRQSDEVSPQYSLNIADVVQQFPKTAFSSNSSPIKFDTPAMQTKEIERLLLRYNSAIRHLLKQYTDFSVQIRRMRDNHFQAVINKQYMQQLGTIEQVIAAARVLNKRLYCCSMEQFLRFMREIGFLGPSFRAIDCMRTLQTMREQHQAVATNKLYNYKKALFDIAEAEKDALRTKYATSQQMPTSRTTQRTTQRSGRVKSPQIVSPSKPPTAGLSSTQVSLSNVNVDLTESPVKSGRGNATVSARNSSSPSSRSPSRNNGRKSPKATSANINPAAMDLPEIPSPALFDVSWNDIFIPIETIYRMDEFEPRANDPDLELAYDQAITEREFIELFVRCVGVVYSRKTRFLNGMNLYYAVEEVLAQKVSSCYTANRLNGTAKWCQ